MAKVIGPLHSSEARGRMGGLVFNTFRGMATVKAKHAPAQPRSSLQLRARANATTLSRTWAASAFHAEWNAYAAAHPYLDGMGLTIRATGLNWFIACNSRLIAGGFPQITEPPATAAPGAVTGLALTPGAGEISVAWSDPAAADDRLEFWLDGPRSKGRLTSIARIKREGLHVGNSSPDVLAGLQPGRWTVWARSWSSYTGLVGPWVNATCDVT